MGSVPNNVYRNVLTPSVSANSQQQITNSLASGTSPQLLNQYTMPNQLAYSNLLQQHAASLAYYSLQGNVAQCGEQVAKPKRKYVKKKKYISAVTADNGTPVQHVSDEFGSWSADETEELFTIAVAVNNLLHNHPEAAADSIPREMFIDIKSRGLYIGTIMVLNDKYVKAGKQARTDSSIRGKLNRWKADLKNWMEYAKKNSGLSAENAQIGDVHLQMAFEVFGKDIIAEVYGYVDTDFRKISPVIASVNDSSSGSSVTGTGTSGSGDNSDVRRKPIQTDYATSRKLGAIPVESDSEEMPPNTIKKRGNTSIQKKNYNKEMGETLSHVLAPFVDLLGQQTKLLSQIFSGATASENHPPAATAIRNKRSRTQMENNFVLSEIVSETDNVSCDDEGFGNRNTIRASTRRRIIKS